MSLGKAGAVALALGIAFLVLPLPSSGCPSALAVWGSTSPAAPADSPPVLDDKQPADDIAAVETARTAVANHDAQVLAARRLLAAVPVTVPVALPVTRTVTVARSDTSALEASVRQDRADRDAAKASRDQVVERQQASGDPASYDAEVAAAQEELDLAEAQLAGDEAALARARRPVPVAVPVAGAVPPTPSAAVLQARTTVAAATATRVGLQKQVAAAEQTQVTHLEARRMQLASWASRHGQAVAAAKRTAAHIADCRQKAVLPGAVGSGFGVLGAGLLLARWRRRAV